MEKDLIYDVGMYRGEDTSYYLSKGFNVIAIEANPYLVWRNYFKFMKYLINGKLKIINRGIGLNTCKAKFYINKSNLEWSSFGQLGGCRPAEWKPFSKNVIDKTNSKCKLVNTVLFMEIIKKYGVPYYLKVDIEGNDYLCIETLSKLNDLPKYVSCEVSKNFEDSLNRISLLGYSKFKLVKQGEHGRDFPFSSSGPFGEEAIDTVSGTRWRTKSEIIQTLKESYDKEIAWYDWHARLG